MTKDIDPLLTDVAGLLARDESDATEIVVAELVAALATNGVLSPAGIEELLARIDRRADVVGMEMPDLAVALRKVILRVRLAIEQHPPTGT